MLCNLWHIKQTNGLFYYALDYVRAIQPAMEVVVRAELLEPARRALPGHPIRAVEGRQLIGRLLQARWRGEWVFTPTSHPFPLVSRQLVVVHDDYPFLGPRGDLKRKLFRLAIRLSGCHVGHINHSTALRAVPQDLVPPEKRWYLPNLGPEDDAIARVRKAQTARRVEPGERPRLRVALFGTDSRKKRYEDLFQQVGLSGAADSLSFLIYGHETDYYRELVQRFPGIQFELVQSGLSLDELLGSVDAVASIALHEGFGRPIALALSAGIPAFLIEAEVFKEFFGSSTPLYPSVPELVGALQQAASQMQAPSVVHDFQALPLIRQAFAAATGRLSALASPASRA